jgi:tRNA(Ile)-lysidine synthase
VADDRTASLADAFERALNDIRARVFVSAAPVIAVAYSGGLDSSVLLQLARRYTHEHGIQLFAFHVHHGLSTNADAWLKHCARECRAADIAFDSRQVSVITGNSIEQEARIQRYAALGQMCTEHGVKLLLTAHHQDDQAETVLLQLLRGSGVAGLCGMEVLNRAPDLLQAEEVWIGRPLLDVSRTELEAFIASSGIAYVDDESNTDVRYTRNALRHGVMPSLSRHFPGYAERLGRGARHAQAAQRLLDQLAAQDMASCADGDSLSLDALNTLEDHDRIDNVFRYWFASKGARMPSTAWLTEMRRQLSSIHDDAQIRVTHGDCEIRRYQGRVYMTPRLDEKAIGNDLPIPFCWNGEACIEFPSYHGMLRFEQVAPGTGLDANWLRDQELSLHARRGGERLKIAQGRPARSLKQHYQAVRIPAWERPFLPLVSTVRGQLVFAAGIGLNHQGFPGGDIRLCWERANQFAT